MTGIKEKEVCALLKKWMQKHGMTQKELAECCKVSQPVLSRQLSCLESIPIARIRTIINLTDPPATEIVQLISLLNPETGAQIREDHAQAICTGGSGADLKAGDTVRLRSGGPLMTVLEERESVVRCAWFQGKENREGSFPAAALDREDPAWRRKE